jgi:exopolysaccharide biosynthesis polyprenyl glycosylphosphotransferase
MDPQRLDQDPDGVASPPVRTGEEALLTRLNARGFRLIQVLDLVALSTIVVGQMWIRHGWDWPTYDRAFYLVSFVVTIDIFMASLYFGGMYEREPRLGYPPALPRALRQTLAAGGLVALLNLAASGLARNLGWIGANNRALPMPTPNLITLIVLGGAAVAIIRKLAHLVQYNREGPPRVLLVGAPDDVETARAHIATDRARAEVVAEASDTRQLIDRVRDTGATNVVLLSSQWLDSLYPTVLQALDRAGITVLQRVTAKETMFGLERVRQIGGLPFVLLRAHTMPISRERFKRFTDLLLVVALSPIFVPLLALVATYVAVFAGRPVLFWQSRVGADSRTFQMVKFRTMRPDAEEDGNARLATHDDPRIIPAMKWLRATRFDELPQLWNVLKGEMSLVGPRPERPELTEQFERIIPGYGRRHEIPPGLTGLAQIHGRYHTDPEYKLGYDLQYLVNWSPVLDLEILARTVWVVLARRI